MDLLVRAFNRAYFDQQLALRLLEAHREGRRLALMVVDADDFSAINDRWGRDAATRSWRCSPAASDPAWCPKTSFARYDGDRVRGPALVRVGRTGAGLRATVVQPHLEHAVRGRRRARRRVRDGQHRAGPGATAGPEHGRSTSPRAWRAPSITRSTASAARSAPTATATTSNQQGTDRPRRGR